MTKRSSSSSFVSCSSSSYSLASTSLAYRLATIFKKAYELSTLCAVEVCVIYFGPNGDLKTWPEETELAKNIAFRYIQLGETQRRKKSFNLTEFLNKKKKDDTSNLSNKKAKTMNPNELKYLISDHSSLDQISELTQSLDQNFYALKERFQFLEARKQKETEVNHRKPTTPMSLNHQETQFISPSQFSLIICNHGDDTFSQIPLPSSNFNLSGFENQLMKQDLCGYDPNMMSMSAIDNNNSQHLCVSNTQDCSTLLTVEETDLMNQLMQKELHGFQQNMCLGNNNKFLEPYANMVCGGSSFSQDMTSSYGINFDESSLFQTSTLW